jgi:hypothetical protein
VCRRACYVGATARPSRMCPGRRGRTQRAAPRAIARQSAMLPAWCRIRTGSGDQQCIAAAEQALLRSGGAGRPDVAQEIPTAHWAPWQSAAQTRHDRRGDRRRPDHRHALPGVRSSGRAGPPACWPPSRVRARPWAPSSGCAAIGAAHGSRGSGCRRRRGERFIGRTLVPHR